MNRSRLSFFVILCWALLMLPTLVLAQVGGPAPDDDGDGIPNDVDVCPQQAGPREFGGCPDSDGDGISDNMDACPTQGGPDSNRGCPVEQPAENPVPENRTNTVRPVVGGDCTLATFLTTAVNVRDYPASDASILGTLDPTVLYPVLGMYANNGETWYLVATGWVNGIAVVLGGNCGGAVRVDYFPDYGTLTASPEDLRRYCVSIFGYEVCWGKGPVVASDGSMGGDSEGRSWKKICKGIKGKIVCFLVEEVVFAIWDWWNADDGEVIDPTLGPDILVFDDPTPDDSGAKKICKGIKGKIICFVVEEIISWFVDWWNEDDSEGLIYNPFDRLIFVPAQSTNTGDASPNDGTTYPFCEDLLNRTIMEHTPDDGTSPVRSEVIGEYLVTYFVPNPNIPLPEQQPCKKWVDTAMGYELENVLISGYQVQYDSWPPNGWLLDILGNSTVPVVPLSAYNSGIATTLRAPLPKTYLVIDFINQIALVEDGGVFFQFDGQPDGTTAGDYNGDGQVDMSDFIGWSD